MTTKRMGWMAAVALVASAGCQSAPEIGLEPASGSLAGYYPVQLTLPEDGPAAADVTEVRFGVNRTYGFEVVSERELSVIVQGDPTSGAVDVVVDGGGEATTFEEAFTYDPPLDPAFERVMALGASYTQGVQAAVPSDHAALTSPGHVLAAQTGAYMGLPQLVPDLFKPMTPEGIGGPPDCVVPQVVAYLGHTVVDALTTMTDPETNEFAFTYGRVDSDIEVRNVGVGGFRSHEVLFAPDDGDLYREFLAHLVYDPYAGIYDPLPASPVELAEELEPTLIVSVDLYGNDLVVPMLEGNVISPDGLVPVEQFDVEIEQIVDRLAATGAEVFMANVPEVTVLPAADERKRYILTQGWMDEEDIDEALAAIDDIVVDYNAAFQKHADDHPNVHVVDFATKLNEVMETGIEVGDTTLTLARFGGLVSVDGLHLSDCGYAMMSNYFIEDINAALGTDVPLVDMEAVLAGDPQSPAALTAAGLDPTECFIEFD